MADIFDFYVYDDRSIRFAIAEPIMLEDKDVTQFRFRIPKVLNNIDMTDWEWWFIFVNAKKVKYTTQLTLTDDDDDPDNFSVATYTVGYGFSGYVGSVSFSIEALNVLGEDIVNEWHTRTYNTQVIDTLQGTRAVIPEPEADAGTGLTAEEKSLILELFAKAAYAESDAGTAYEALETIWTTRILTRITATYTQSGTVYDTYVLDRLKPDLVVTARYDDGTSAAVVGYALSGTLEEGTSTITVSYSGKTTTFNVTVSARIPSAYKQIEYLESDGTQGITTDIIPRDTETIVTFEFTGYRANADNFVTGVYNANNQRYYACWLNNSGKLMFYNRSNALKWTGPTNPIGKHTVDFNNASHQALYDGEIKATDSTFALTAENNKVAIFCRGRDTTEAYLSTTSIVRIYSLKYVDNTTGNAIGEFIPCYRKADNVGGMYDLVSETFYTDAISGNPFTLGSGAWETGA